MLPEPPTCCHPDGAFGGMSCWKDFTTGSRLTRKAALLFGVTLVVVPLIVYAISAFFALILWGIECAEREEDGMSRRLSATATADVCSYYEWWIYLVGNLVGVRLTDVGDQLSDHKLVQVVDIVVSTWSLALTGGVVGLVGLTLMPLMSSKPEPLPSNVTADGGADGIAAGGSGAIASEDERLRETINAAVEAAVEAKLKQMLPELTTALSAAVTKHRHERREHTRSRPPARRTQPQGPETIESEQQQRQVATAGAAAGLSAQGFAC